MFYYENSIDTQSTIGRRKCRKINSARDIDTFNSYYLYYYSFILIKKKQRKNKMLVENSDGGGRFPPADRSRGAVRTRMRSGYGI